MSKRSKGGPISSVSVRSVSFMSRDSNDVEVIGLKIDVVGKESILSNVYGTVDDSSPFGFVFPREEVKKMRIRLNSRGVDFDEVSGFLAGEIRMAVQDHENLQRSRLS